MQHDRDYYRAMSVGTLLTAALEDGINPEMAIVIAEELAIRTIWGEYTGKFHFNERTTNTHA